MNAHPLKERITTVARRVRAAMLLASLGRFVALAVAVVTLLALADYLVHYEDRGIRIISFLAAVGSLLWIAYRYFFGLLADRPHIVQVAQRIEQRYPELDQKLSSALVFLDQEEEDLAAGSPSLRRAVVGEVTGQLESIDLARVVSFRPATRSLALALLACLVAGTLTILAPSAARIALVRLAGPLGTTSWPKWNDLEFVDPVTRLASGQDFDVELTDRNHRLPDVVKICYRYPAGDDWSDEESVPMQYVDGRMVAHKKSVARPFQYRAIGGDDTDMSWIAVEVVEPPRVESFQVLVHAPNYTGLPPRSSEKRIQALVGSRIAITGLATKPLSAARLGLEKGGEIEATVSSDGYRFTIVPEQFLIEQSDAYWFELEDAESNYSGRQERWGIQAVPDTAPSVIFEKPQANLFVTADAVLPLRIVVKDNLHIHDISLRYLRSDRSEEGEFTKMLFEGPEQVESVSSEVTGFEVERRVVDELWQLRELRLTPGTQLSVLAVATDYVPQMGQSLTPRRITIITPGELEDRLATRQRLILSELARVLKIQQRARAQIETLKIQLREVGHLEKSDLDQLQAAELNQQQVRRTLTDTKDGIPQYVSSLLEDLDNNRIDNPDMFRRMRGILQEIRNLEENELSKIQQEMTAALKTSLSDPRNSSAEDRLKRTSKSLAATSDAQDRVIAALERQLGDLSEWDDYRRFARDVRQIHSRQQELAERTKQIGIGPQGREGTLTKDFSDLTSQQFADLAKASRRQSELARSLDKLLQAVGQTSRRLNEKDPLSSATLQDALHLARKQQISGKMQSAASRVEKNQLGQAAEQQEQVGKALEELLDVLANRREHELTRLVDQLLRAESELAELRAQQHRLRKKFQQLEKQEDSDERRRELERLRRRQRDNQEAIDRMARRLKRLRADSAARSAQQASSKLGSACKACEQGDAAGAAEKARAAEKDLDEAQEQLAQARREAESDLAREQMEQLEDTLRGMIELEQRLLDDTIRLDGLRSDEGSFGPDQSASLRDIARAQLAVQEEATRLASNMGSDPVFQLALGGAAESMGIAGDQLSQGATGPGVQSRQRDAITRLSKLRQALQPDLDDDGKLNGKGNSGGGGGGGGQGGCKRRDIAELKLIKLLQEELNRRTLLVHESLAPDTVPNSHQQDELLRIAEEQGRLADIVLDLVESEDATAGDQDFLPELDLEIEDVLQ